MKVMKNSKGTVTWRLRFPSVDELKQANERVQEEQHKRNERFARYGFVNNTDENWDMKQEKRRSIAGVRRKKLVTVRRSPHVNKKHRDQYLMTRGNTSRIAYTGDDDQTYTELIGNRIAKLQNDLNKKRVELKSKRNRDIESRLVFGDKREK